MKETLCFIILVFIGTSFIQVRCHADSYIAADTQTSAGGKPKASRAEKATFGKSKRKKKSYQRSVKRHNKRIGKDAKRNPGMR